MTPDPEITQKSRGSIIKRKVEKIFQVADSPACNSPDNFLLLKYFYTYSDGYRAGLLQKFSRKGTIFKTYEGELILSSVTGNTGNNSAVIASEKFYFSVRSDSLAAQSGYPAGKIGDSALSSEKCIRFLARGFALYSRWS